MKIATSDLRQPKNFQTVTAYLTGIFWRGVLIYMLLWSMCLGGNCGIWSEPALAAPLHTAPVLRAGTNGMTLIIEAGCSDGAARQGQ
jgi:hypothetical protein